MSFRNLVKCLATILVMAPTLAFAHSQYEELIDLLTTSTVASITFTNYGNTAIVEMGTNAPARCFQLYATRAQDPLFLRFLADRHIACTVAQDRPMTTSNSGSLAWIILAYVAITVPVGILLMMGKISSTLEKMLRVFSKTDKGQD